MSSSPSDHDHEWSPGARGVKEELEKLVTTVTSRTEEAEKSFESKDYKKAHVVAKVHSLKTRTAFLHAREASGEILRMTEYGWKNQLKDVASDKAIIQRECAKPTTRMTPKALRDHHEHIELHVRTRDRAEARAQSLHRTWSFETIELEKILLDTHLMINHLENLAEDAKNAREGKAKKVSKHVH